MDFILTFLRHLRQSYLYEHELLSFPLSQPESSSQTSYILTSNIFRASFLTPTIMYQLQIGEEEGGFN